MRVIVRTEVIGISKGGFVKLYNACKGYNALIKHADPASNSFYIRVHFDNLGNDALLKIRELIGRLSKASSYCEVLVTAIVPHKGLPPEIISKYGCPEELEKRFRRICAKYVRSTYETRGLLEIGNDVLLLICRRRATQILPVRGNFGIYSLTSPPSPTRISCDDVATLDKVLKKLRDAVSLLRQHLTQSEKLGDLR